MVPNSDSSALPSSRPSSSAGMASSGMRSMIATGPAASSSGTPVTSQCDAAFAAAMPNAGRPDSSSRSSEPSSRSAPNSRSSGSSAASSAQTQTMPGAIRPSVSGAGPIASGNSEAVTMKNSSAARVSAPCRTESRRSRSRTAQKTRISSAAARPRPAAAAARGSPPPPSRRRPDGAPAIRRTARCEAVSRPSVGSSSSHSGAVDNTSRDSASRRFCPADSIRAGRSASASSPTASNAARIGRPETAAAKRRFSVTVKPGLHRVLVPEIGHPPPMPGKVGQARRRHPTAAAPPPAAPTRPTAATASICPTRSVRQAPGRRPAAPPATGRETPASRRGTPPRPLPPAHFVPQYHLPTSHRKADGRSPAGVVKARRREYFIRGVFSTPRRLNGRHPANRGETGA